MNINELNTHIIEWAKERELDTKGTVEAQAIKTVEELSELIKAICKNKKEDIIDSIGDVYVTLVIGNMIGNGTNIELISEKTTDLFYDEIIEKIKDYSKTLLLLDISRDIDSVLQFKYSSWVVGQTMALIMSIAYLYNLDFTECVESAYNTIKNRHGKLIDGMYIKDEDLQNEVNNIFFGSSTNDSH